MRAFAVGRLRRLEYLAVLSAVLFVAGLALVSAAAGGGLWRDLGRLSGPLVAGLLGLSLVNYALRAWRWLIYAERLGLRVPPARNVLFFIAGFALGTTPGKVGEAFRVWLIERSHGYRYERVTPLFIGDRLSDMNGVLALSLVGAWGFPGDWRPAAGIALAVALVTLAFVRPRLLIAALDVGYVAFGRRARRLFAKARTALRMTARLFHWRLYLSALALSMAGWFAECLAFHWLMDGLGHGLPLLQSVFVFTFAAVVGAVSMLPGGLGSAEAAMLGLLTALGVGFDTALLATAVIRVTTLWFGVGLGFLAMPMALRLARRSGPATVAAEP